MKTAQQDELVLISHKLCPYVQRAITTLEEAGMKYKRLDIDLANKPAWFKKISPLGKVPVLVVNDDVVLFESTAISEYINDISGNTMLSAEPLQRARQRAWVEFASATINNLGQLYKAQNQSQFSEHKKDFIDKASHLEENLSETGYFDNKEFSIVDAAFAPVFRYIDLFENLANFTFLDNYPRIQQWRKLLSERGSVKRSARTEYPTLLLEFIAARDSFLGQCAREYQRAL